MCWAALALARFAANIGAIRLKAASDCQTNNPAASRTKKMQVTYLQHVFRWTTNAGSFECSSFVLRKPAAPSRSMAVCGIMFLVGVLLRLVGGGERAAASYVALAATRGAFYWRLGCVTRWVRGLWQRARCAVVGEAGCATRAQALVSDAVQGSASDTRRWRSLPPFFLAAGTRVASAPVGDRKLSRGVLWTAPTKKGSGSPNVSGFACSVEPHKTCYKVAAAARLRRIH